MVFQETLSEIEFLLPQANRYWQPKLKECSSDEEFERLLDHKPGLKKFTAHQNKLLIFTFGLDINPEFDITYYIEFLAQVTLFDDAFKDWSSEEDPEAQTLKNSKSLQAFAEVLSPIHKYWQSSLI